MGNAQYGKNLVLEGCDLSGKSTSASKLVEYLKSQGKNAIYTRHPGATPLGKELRRIIENPELSVDGLTRGLLFATDNCAYISSVLKPALERGVWVISDRNNFISSIAYQIADGCSFDQLDRIHAATYPVDQIPKIDLLMVLRVDYETACSRRAAARTEVSKSETFEKKMASRQFFDKVADAYDQLLTKHTDRLLKFVQPTSLDPTTPKCLYIDATKPFEVMFSNIVDAVQSLA
jgi:dTMP kinase